MKHSKPSFRYLYLALLMLALGAGMASADEAAYTLTFTKVVGATKYATPYSVESNGRSWEVQGALSAGNYLRVGGTNRTATDRTLTSQVPIVGQRVRLVTLHHSGTNSGKDSQITIHSIKVEGAPQSDFGGARSSVQYDPELAGTALHFAPAEGWWEAQSYFRITVNYSITGSNNCYLRIDSVDFYTTAADAPKHTARFSVNGTCSSSHDCTVGEGEPITFPPAPADISGKHFAGWTRQADYAHPSAAPADLCTAALMGTTDVTYYAVFATSQGGGEQWREVLASPDEGVYALCTTAHFMKASIASNRFENGSATPAISEGMLLEAPPADCQWEITRPDAYYRIGHGGQYAGATSSKNQGALLPSADDSKAKWTITFAGTRCDIINLGRSVATTDEGNKYLQNNGSYGWGTYSATGGYPPRLFRREGGSIDTDYATIVDASGVALPAEYSAPIAPAYSIAGQPLRSPAPGIVITSRRKVLRQ